MELFSAWRDAGVTILPFGYEAFTQAPESEGTRLFDALGLDWDAAYLDPSARPEAVPTFSSRQVRQPIRAKARPAWKDYESFAPGAFARLAEITKAQNEIVDKGQNC